MRMSTMATSGAVPFNRPPQGLGFAHGTVDHEASVHQELDESVTQDGRVLGDDDANRVGHLGVQRQVNRDHRRAPRVG